MSAACCDISDDSKAILFFLTEKPPIDKEGYFYDVPIAQLQTLAGICHWFTNLSEKEWFVGEVRWKFERLAVGIIFHRHLAEQGLADVKAQQMRDESAGSN